MLKMSEQRWEWLEMSGHGWNCRIWIENDWNKLELPEIDGYSWTFLEMDITGREWRKITGIAENG